jgi:hypothetical protein
MYHADSRRAAALLLAVAATSGAAEAKPIAYAHGATVMAEYGAETMEELQVFYAPRYDLSVGGGLLRLESDLTDATRSIAYGRVNYLVKRWNLEGAQANVFTWGGAGGARVDDDHDVLAWNAGAQVDFETRRVYASLKSDFQASSDFSHRIDTVQLGLAPYAHEYDRIATWFVLQGRDYTGSIHSGTEWALLLRLFKGGAWIEAGVTDEGKLQAMLMINF